MRHKIELFLIILMIAGLLILNKNLEEFVQSDQVENREKVIVIDPGHGGADPGKVGVNQALEKDVNLAIAHKVKNSLEEKGIKVIMTREDDRMFADEDSTHKKIDDMKERIQLIDSANASLTISIHQNSYHESGVKGSQVFYFTHSPEAKKYAEIMQNALLQADADNTRKEKANDTYYLLKRTKTPTIIVECGFLSNPEEAEKLISEEYQEILAEAISDGIITCLED